MHRHSALLVAIIVAYAVRPLMGGGGAGHIAFSAALLALLLLALYNIDVDELVGDPEYLLVQSPGIADPAFMRSTTGGD